MLIGLYWWVRVWWISSRRARNAFECGYLMGWHDHEVTGAKMDLDGAWHEHLYKQTETMWLHQW